MNEKRNAFANLDNNKRNSYTQSDALTLADILAKKAQSTGNFKLMREFEKIKKSVASQKDLSKKVIKSTLNKIDLLEKQLEFQLAQKNMQNPNQKTR